MILSIIVISHNQKDELDRCIKSILAQELPFEHEIIISDDASKDGTWELAQEYEMLHPEIKAFQCNSDDCNPANNSQRSGWNRCNAYPHASGKYIAHVDADDFFRPGADVYRRQVEMLEKHPECSICISNILKYNEGDDLSKATPWYENGIFEEGLIMQPETFIRKGLFILNQACIQRRNPDVDPIQLYGKRYVDSIITYHHMQFGQIVFVDACDYVYCIHDKSVTNQIGRTRDHEVLWCLGLYVSALIPRWRGAYLSADLTKIKRVVSMSREGYRLQENNRKSLEGLGFFIYGAFNRDLGALDKIRLFCAEFFLKSANRLKLKGRFISKAIYLLVCR